MANLIAKNKGNIAAYFAVHSYSQLWMYPYGYTNTKPANAAELVSCAKSSIDYDNFSLSLKNKLSAAGVSAIKAKYGLTFKYGTIASTICKSAAIVCDG